jgi:UDP-glucose 4-epimerase
VIDTAARVTGQPIRLELAGRRSGDPAVLVASSERIARDLGWQPRRQELDPIVSSAWKWLQQRGMA